MIGEIYEKGNMVVAQLEHQLSDLTRAMVVKRHDIHYQLEKLSRLNADLDYLKQNALEISKALKVLKRDMLGNADIPTKSEFKL